MLYRGASPLGLPDTRSRSCLFAVISRRRMVGEDVADAANRVDQRLAETAVDLVSERVDVDFDDVADAVEVDVPHVLDDERLGHGTIAVPDEELEQRVFLRLEIDRLSGAADDAAQGIHFEVRYAQDVFARGAAPH